MSEGDSRITILNGRFSDLALALPRLARPTGNALRRDWSELGGMTMPTDDRSALIAGEKRLGTVTKVSATGIELNLPQALAAAGRRGVALGTVGDFVFIDCDRAVFGATGGGKSWTLAKLVAEVSSLGGKAIVFDPTGEFSGKFRGAVEYAFSQADDGQTLVRFPSEAMTELSLFVLLRPTGQSQGPTMREAIRSLRLARALKNDQQLQAQEIA